MKRWVWIEDEPGIRIIMATVIASMMPGDPIWMFIVAPPGGLKTEICRSLCGPQIYSLDTLTPQSLISGFRAKKGVRVDILPDLDGKLLVIKDFTAILNQAERVRDELLGRLRAAYDGYLEQAYGTGVKKKSFKSTFGILAGVTPVIEIYHKIHALLGERFISVKAGYNREKAVEYALKHSGQEAQMREEIQLASRAMIDFYKIQCNHFIPSSQIAYDIPKIELLSQAVSILRSPVPRDYQRAVIYTPEAEVGSRIGKQFLRLSQSLDVLNGYEYSVVKRCGWDCVSPARRKIIELLGEIGETNTSNLSDLTKLSRNMVLTECENLWMFEVLDRREDKNTFIFRIRPEFEKILKGAELI